MKLLESIFGANWRTTLSGWITVGSAAIIIEPDLVDFIGDPWSKRVIGFCKLCAVISGGTFAARTKDRQVTGNDSATNPNRVNDGSLTGRIVPLITLIPALLLASCVTGADGKLHPKPLTASQKAMLQDLETRSENAVLAAASAGTATAATDAGTQFASTGKVNGQELATEVEAAAIGAGLRAAFAPTAPAIVQSATNYVATGAPTPLIQAAAPVLSQQIATVVNAGVPQALAVEAAAKGADAATKVIAAP